MDEELVTCLKQTLKDAKIVYGNVCIVSSLGVGSMVIIHFAHELRLEFPILHIDTGFHFTETRDFKELVVKRYGGMLEASPINETALPFDDPDRCCYRRKVVPLRIALELCTAWISGLRRDQGPTRNGHSLTEYGLGKVKINPLIDWTLSDVWNAIRKYGIPYNPLYDQGYKSIGCTFCTKKVEPEAEERSGRWVGHEKVECGIHQK